MHTTIENSATAFQGLTDAVKLLENAVQTAGEASARGDNDVSYRQDIALWATTVARRAESVAKLALA